MTPSAAARAPASILLVAGDGAGDDPLAVSGCGPREGAPVDGAPMDRAPVDRGLVDGDPLAGDLEDGRDLPEQLLADGYVVRVARTATHARALARGSPPDAVLIQAQHRLREALDLLLEIRGGGVSERSDDPDDAPRDPHPPRGYSPPCPWPARIPVIVIAARHSRIDVLRAFEAGADDYLAAPLCYLELRARLRVLLERERRADPRSIVRAGPLTIDTTARSVTLHGRRPVVLPRLQYELLLALAREPRRVIARSELTRRLWGEQPSGSTRTLDSHASRLRRALSPERSERWIVSVRGVGYRLR